MTGLGNSVESNRTKFLLISMTGPKPRSNVGCQRRKLLQEKMTPQPSPALTLPTTGPSSPGRVEFEKTVPNRAKLTTPRQPQPFYPVRAPVTPTAPNDSGGNPFRWTSHIQRRVPSHRSRALPPETATGPVNSQNTSGNARHVTVCYHRKTGGEVRFFALFDRRHPSNWLIGVAPANCSKTNPNTTIGGLFLPTHCLLPNFFAKLGDRSRHRPDR